MQDSREVYNQNLLPDHWVSKFGYGSTSIPLVMDKDGRIMSDGMVIKPEPRGFTRSNNDVFLNLMGRPRSVNYVEVGTYPKTARFLELLSSGLVPDHMRMILDESVGNEEISIARGMELRENGMAIVINGGLLVEQSPANSFSLKRPNMQVRIDDWRREHAIRGGGEDDSKLGTLSQSGWENKIRYTPIAGRNLQIAQVPKIQAYGTTSADTEEKPHWLLYTHPQAICLQELLGQEMMAMRTASEQSLAFGLPISNWAFFKAAEVNATLLRRGMIHHTADSQNYLVEIVDQQSASSGHRSTPTLIVKDFEGVEIVSTAEAIPCEKMSGGIDRLIMSCVDFGGQVLGQEVLALADSVMKQHLIKSALQANLITGFEVGLGIHGDNPNPELISQRILEIREIVFAQLCEGGVNINHAKDITNFSMLCDAAQVAIQNATYLPNEDLVRESQKQFKPKQYKKYISAQKYD
jgi:hypothetical protein